MKTYVYIVKVIKPTHNEIQTGTVTCDHFWQAVNMALDTEGVSWEGKRAYRELLSLTKVES